MRSISSCFDFTCIPLSICFVILLKKLSIIFSQESCFGVNTNSNFHSGIVDRKAFVSFNVCAEWLSSMIRIVSCAGYFKSSIFRKHTKSPLLWVSLTSGMASPISRSIPPAVKLSQAFYIHSYEKPLRFFLSGAGHSKYLQWLG